MAGGPAQPGKSREGRAKPRGPLVHAPQTTGEYRQSGGEVGDACAETGVCNELGRDREGNPGRCDGRDDPAATHHGYLTSAPRASPESLDRKRTRLNSS